MRAAASALMGALSQVQPEQLVQEDREMLRMCARELRAFLEVTKD
jgi:hypothetical protein